MKILFPIDDKTTVAEVVDYVRNRSFPEDTEIRLLSVIQPTEMMVPWSVVPVYPAEIYNEMNQSADRLLHSAMAELHALGLKNVTLETGFGPSVPAIVDELKQFQPDLVVLGSHSRNWLEKVLVGSVAESVAEQAPCSVLVLKPSVATAKK